MKFPNDDNGDVLRRMEAHGDDLALSRDIDFTVVFPSQYLAERFAAHFRQQGYAASSKFTETAEKLPWDVVVVKHMLPLHQDITDFEVELDDIARPLEGRIDGWGSLSQQRSSFIQ